MYHEISRQKKEPNNVTCLLFSVQYQEEILVLGQKQKFAMEKYYINTIYRYIRQFIFKYL